MGRFSHSSTQKGQRASQYVTGHPALNSKYRYSGPNSYHIQAIWDQIRQRLPGHNTKAKAGQVRHKSKDLSYVIILLPSLPQRHWHRILIFSRSPAGCMIIFSPSCLFVLHSQRILALWKNDLIQHCLINTLLIGRLVT